MNVNTPLGGERPIMAVSVLNFITLLTSVAATSAGNYTGTKNILILYKCTNVPMKLYVTPLFIYSTVVFLGTDDGHLKKV